MPFLIFLLLGTLLFGFAFPAFILGIGLFAIIIFIAIIIGILRGGMFRVYTNRTYGPDANRYAGHTTDDSTYIGPTDDDVYPPKDNEGSDVFAEEGEVIELPSSALRKEGEEKKD